MHILCIIISLLLVSTGTNCIPTTTTKLQNLIQVNAKGVSADPDDPYDYYDEQTDNRDNSVLNDKNSEDSTLRPVFVTSPHTVTAKLGQKVHLDCVTQNAESYVTMWRKDQEQISLGTNVHDERVFALKPNNTLIIRRMKPQLSGYYSCVVLISKDDHITLTHRLKLEDAAEITSLYSENNKTKFNSGEKLTLTCEVKGKPMPDIKWYFNTHDEEKSVPISSSNDLRTEDRNTLVIENLGLKNSGVYRCEANNGESTDHQSIHIDVFDKGRTEAAKEQSDSRTGGNSAHLASSITLLLTTFVLLNQ